MGDIFNQLIVWPITNALLIIYKTLVFLHFPYPLGFSIIILTIAIRLVLYPLTASQLRVSKKMQELSPHIKKIKEKHKKDAKKQQEETMRLYKEHGVNPAAGCLPSLLQLPIIWGLYSVFQQIINLKPGMIVATINKIAYAPLLRLQAPWEQYFFTLPLAQTPSQLMGAMGPMILLVPFLTGVFQLIQAKMMIPVSVPNQPKKEGGESDFATAFQTQSLYIFPVMIGYFSFQFPIALSLYWNVFTIFGILQQYKIAGLGGLSQWMPKKKS